MTIRKSIVALAIVLVSTAAVVARWQSRDSGTAVVSGVVVTDAANPQPVRRATVRLAGGIGTSGRVVGTDDQGRFRFDALAAGTYTLSASKPGYVQTFYGSRHPGRGPAVPIVVAAGQGTDVTLPLLPGGVITGVISDPRGNPARGVVIAAVETRPVLGVLLPPVRATTDDLGTYRLFGLAPGDYLVTASPQMAPADGRGGTSSAAIPVTTASEVQWANTLGGPGGAGAAAPPAGSVVAYAPVFYPGTTNATEAATVRVASGEERAGIGMALRLAPMARIAGALLDPNGQAVTSAVVTLYPRRGEQPSPADSLVSSGVLVPPRATVWPDGFVFSGVAPGEYTLVARTGIAQRGAPPPSASDPPILWHVSDLVVDGSDRNDLTVRLMPGQRMMGVITYDQSKLIPPPDYPVDVSLVAANPIPGVPAPRAVMTNDTFRFTSIPPGTYVLRASIARSAQGWSLKSALLNRRDLADFPFEAIVSGDELRVVTATLTDRGAEIAGRLIDEANRPVARYSIVVFTTNQALWLPNARRIQLVQPANDGSFSVAGLPAGEYAIAAVADAAAADLADTTLLTALLSSAIKVTLAEGDRKRQDLRVQPGAPVR